jgi:2-polyprenyl-3-methyl-5-hydroxy-6-metoxy-1,4-benzoquinol methylase
VSEVTPAEDLAYKALDHEFRARDAYAWTKYDMTTDWIAPFVRPGMLLLNVGCGGGEYNRVAVEMGLRVLACEPERNAFELALRNRPAASCEVRHCGLFDLRPGPDDADVIVMHDVLEHIEDDAGGARQVAALLRPGGRLVISVPAMQWLFGHHDVLLGHYRRYTKKRLRAVIEPHLRLRRIRYFGMSLIPAALWFSRLSKRPYPIQQVSDGPLSAIMRTLCAVERRIPTPLGTSVMAEFEALRA